MGMPLGRTRQKVRKAAALGAHISYWSLIAGMILVAAAHRGYQNKLMDKDKVAL